MMTIYTYHYPNVNLVALDVDFQKLRLPFIFIYSELPASFSSASEVPMNWSTFI